MFSFVTFSRDLHPVDSLRRRDHPGVRARAHHRRPQRAEAGFAPAAAHQRPASLHAGLGGRLRRNLGRFCCRRGLRGILVANVKCRSLRYRKGCCRC